MIILNLVLAENPYFGLLASLQVLPRLKTESRNLQMGRTINEFRTWMAETLSHAMGNPREEKMTVPPAIGPQPYSDSPKSGR